MTTSPVFHLRWWLFFVAAGSCVAIMAASLVAHVASVTVPVALVLLAMLWLWYRQAALRLTEDAIVQPRLFARSVEIRWADVTSATLAQKQLEIRGQQSLVVVNLSLFASDHELIAFVRRHLPDQVRLGGL